MILGIGLGCRVQKVQERILAWGKGFRRGCKVWEGDMIWVNGVQSSDLGQGIGMQG